MTREQILNNFKLSPDNNWTTEDLVLHNTVCAAYNLEAYKKTGDNYYLHKREKILNQNYKLLNKDTNVK